MSKSSHSSDRLSLIYRDELLEYSRKPSPKVRVFHYDGEFTSQMIGDGFMYERRGDFYVNLDLQPEKPCPLESGRVIGLFSEDGFRLEMRKIVL